MHERKSANAQCVCIHEWLEVISMLGFLFNCCSALHHIEMQGERRTYKNHSSHDGYQNNKQANKEKHALLCSQGNFLFRIIPKPQIVKR